MTPFTITVPLDGRSPLLLASPHCGTFVPAAVAALLRPPCAAIRRLEDPHVARLMQPAAAMHGVPLIAATHSRAVIDLNRAEDEIDPAMVEGRPPLPPRPTARVRRGYGLVPRYAGGATPLYARRLAPADLADRIERLHRPWHAAIAAGLGQARARHGAAVLLDCHSMPSLEALTAGGAAPDIVLGDLHGQSAAQPLTQFLAEAFRAEGLRVALNRPYAGGHTTERHGRPAEGFHAVQIEVDRALYLDPTSLEPTPASTSLAGLMERIVGGFLLHCSDIADGPLPLAAE